MEDWRYTEEDLKNCTDFAYDRDEFRNRSDFDFKDIGSTKNAYGKSEKSEKHAKHTSKNLIDKFKKSGVKDKVVKIGGKAVKGATKAINDSGVKEQVADFMTGRDIEKENGSYSDSPVSVSVTESRSDMSGFQRVQGEVIAMPAAVAGTAVIDPTTLSREQLLCCFQNAEQVLTEVFDYIESSDKYKEIADKAAGRTKKDLIWFIKMYFKSILGISVGLFFVMVSYTLFHLVFNYGIAAILTLIVSIIAVVVYFNRKKVKARIFDKKAKEAEEASERLLREHEAEISLIPSRYRYPLAVGYMRQLFEERRVSTLNEALDKFDEYFHRLTLEQAASAEAMMLSEQSSALGLAAGVNIATDLIGLLIHI